MEAEKEHSLRFYSLATLVVTLLFVIVSFRWILLYRNGGLLDIDEAGYLGIARFYYEAFLHGGLIRWLITLDAPSSQAPLTTALASLVFLINPHILYGFVIPVLAGAGCIIATYYLGKQIGSPQVGFLAAILIASCPVVVTYARDFHFSLPATFVTTIALLSLLRSEHFDRPGWAALFGFSVGLMPLARTMTIAFIPGVVLGAVIYTLGAPNNRFRRILILFIALLIAMAIAAIWLVPNGRYVFGYLLNFGYGKVASEHEIVAAQSKFGPDAWFVTAIVLIRDIYLPHFLAIVGGILTFFFVVGRLALRIPNFTVLSRVFKSEILPLVIAVVAALLALTSTSNKGSGFFTPILPALIIIVVWAFLQVSGNRYYRLSCMVLIGAIVVIAGTPMLDLHSRFARLWTANVPILGGIVVTDGRSNLQRYEYEGMDNPEDELEPINSTNSKAWMDIDVKTDQAITQLFGKRAVVAFGVRNRFFNVNTVGLRHLVATGVQLGEHQIEPTLTGESVEGYLGWLAREGTDACLLVTSDKITPGDFNPAVNRAFMEEAARQAGFIPAEKLPAAPDGEVFTLWQHNIIPSNCVYSRDTAY